MSIEIFILSSSTLIMKLQNRLKSCTDRKRYTLFVKKKEGVSWTFDTPSEEMKI